MNETPGAELSVEENQNKTIECYETLLQEGGRPPKSVQIDPGPWSWSTSMERHIVRHIDHQLHFFEEELKRWRAFRKWQRHVRETPERFAKTQQNIREWRQRRRFEDEVELALIPEQQTKLNEWKEHHGFQLSKMIPRIKKIRAFKERRIQIKKRIENGKNCQLELSGLEFRISCDESQHREEAKPILIWIESQLPIVAGEAEMLKTKNKPTTPVRSS